MIPVCKEISTKKTNKTKTRPAGRGFLNVKMFKTRGWFKASVPARRLTPNVNSSGQSGSVRLIRIHPGTG